jgi:hypothetical protein
MIINLVLPDINKKMPTTASNMLQEDGAKAHLPDDDTLL